MKNVKKTCKNEDSRRAKKRRKEEMHNAEPPILDLMPYSHFLPSNNTLIFAFYSLLR